MILPICALDSISRWASAALASGKVVWITGATRPESSSGQTLLCKATAMTPFSATERGRIEFTWDIAEGYYLYKHRMGVELVDGGFKTNALELPSGTAYTDEFFGDVETYRGRITAVQTGAAADDATSLTFKVKYQGCADIGICYPPHSKTVTVSLPAPVVLTVVSTQASPTFKPGRTQGKKSASRPCTCAAAGEVPVGVSDDGFPALLRNARNSPPRALSSTAAGIGVALSPFTESMTTRIVRPPALSFSVTVTKVLVLKVSVWLPWPAPEASTSWVRLWSTRYLAVTGASRRAGNASVTAASAPQPPR